MFGHEHPHQQQLIISQHHAELLRTAESRRAGHRRLHGEIGSFRLRRRFRFIRQREPALIPRRI